MEREQDVKLAVGNDGWIDRENNIVTISQPHFSDDYEVGDTMAIGWNGIYGHYLATITEIIKKKSFVELDTITEQVRFEYQNNKQICYFKEN